LKPFAVHATVEAFAVIGRTQECPTGVVCNLRQAEQFFHTARSPKMPRIFFFDARHLLFASQQVNIGQELSYARLKQLADERKERGPNQQCEFRWGCKLFDALPSEMDYGKRTCVKDRRHKTF
jgi:hypothetical protein